MVEVRPLTIEPLNERHDRARFSCGNLALDRYFAQQASQDQRRDVAIVYVARDSMREDDVAGFYTLCTTSVEAAALPPDITKRLPRYPHFPGILIGRLARDERWRAERVGPRLLVDAFDRIVVIAAQIGALFVVVDAKDDAARNFYERFGFQLFPDSVNRLFVSLATIRKMQERFPTAG